MPAHPYLDSIAAKNGIQPFNGEIVIFLETQSGPHFTIVSPCHQSPYLIMLGYTWPGFLLRWLYNETTWERRFAQSMQHEVRGGGGGGGGGQKSRKQILTGWCIHLAKRDDLVALLLSNTLFAKILAFLVLHHGPKT